MSRLVIVLLMVINSALACAQFLIFPPNDTICLGEGLQLSASTSCQGTALYTWYVNGDSILSNGSGTFSLMPTQTSNQLMVICRCNVNGSIQVDTAQTSLTVSSPSIDAGPDQYVDSGTVVTLQTSGLLDSVRWSPSFEVNYPTLFSVQTSPSATTTYMVQGFYAGCEVLESPELAQRLKNTLTLTQHELSQLLPPGLTTRSVVRVEDQVLQPVPLGQVDWLGGPQHDHAMVGFRIAPLVLMHTASNLDDEENSVTIRMRDHAVLEVLYSSGIRVSELTGLDIKDLDLTRCTMRVIGKGNKERVVPFGQPAKEAIQTYLTKARTELANEKSGNALFLGTRGKRLDTRQVRRILTNAIARVEGLVNVSPHDLRHSAATHMLEGGAELFVRHRPDLPV